MKDMTKPPNPETEGGTDATDPMALMREMLRKRAVSLDALFAELAGRAAENYTRWPRAGERYARLALQAQANCRAALEAMAKADRERT